MALPLESVMHVNVNCSELERSLRFYRDLLGLSALSHTRPLPQRGDGFGLEGQVQWDAHLLHDHRGLTAPAVDLLEWQTPEPCGAPPASPNQLGFSRLGFRSPDLDEADQRLRAAGFAPLPRDPASERETRRLCVRDPDGTMLELRQGAGPLQTMWVSVNCSALSRSADWYERVLGLEATGRSSPGPLAGAPFGLQGDVAWDARSFAVRAQAERFAIELVEWERPRPVGRPAQHANQLGMFRMAFLVEDAHACSDALKSDGVAVEGPVWLDMGPDIPIDGLWASFFRDPDGSCLELIQRPELPTG